MTFTAGSLLWSLHVFSGCSGFLPQSKDMYRTKLIGNYKLTTGESGCLNISLLTGWQAVKGVSHPVIAGIVFSSQNPELDNGLEFVLF